MNRTEKLFDGVYLLHGVVGGRPLHLPLLVGKLKCILVNTGCASHVEELILPALRDLDIDPRRLSHIINTHCDVDHQGGNAGMKKAAPDALVCCGRLDRDQVSSPEEIFSQRYDQFREKHDVYYPEETRQWIMTELGDACPIDKTFLGGERIKLGPGWEVELLYLPGHSHGHLGIRDLKHIAVYGGDAIHGSVYLDLEGNPALCPTYLYVKEYLATADRIERMAPDYYCGCHWPVKAGREVTEFCAETRKFVKRAEQLIFEQITSASATDGSTLKELCLKVGPKLGDWPAAVNQELCYGFAGHLDKLSGEGRIKQVPGSFPARYKVSV